MWEEAGIKFKGHPPPSVATVFIFFMQDDQVYASEFQNAISGMNHFMESTPLDHTLFLPEALVKRAPNKDDHSKETAVKEEWEKVIAAQHFESDEDELESLRSGFETLVIPIAKQGHYSDSERSELYVVHGDLNYRYQQPVGKWL